MISFSSSSYQYIKLKYFVPNWLDIVNKTKQYVA